MCEDLAGLMINRHALTGATSIRGRPMSSLAAKKNASPNKVFGDGKNYLPWSLFPNRP